MSTTHHDDSATTWRDLADALTPEQIAYIEHWERHPEIPPMADGKPAPYGAHQAGLLFTAREYVGQNAAGALFADVAPPPEVGEHYPWEHDGDGEWTRFFVGTTRKIGEAQVMILGNQSSDGTISRSIAIDGNTEDLDAAQARQIAVAFLDAADELERLGNQSLEPHVLSRCGTNCPHVRPVTAPPGDGPNRCRVQSRG